MAQAPCGVPRGASFLLKRVGGCGTCRRLCCMLDTAERHQGGNESCLSAFRKSPNAARRISGSDPCRRCLHLPGPAAGLVGPADAGTRHRNHCPNCLASVHLDDEPGDRAADCGGHHGAGGGLGAQGRRVGHHPPLPPSAACYTPTGWRRTTTPSLLMCSGGEAPGQPPLPPAPAREAYTQKRGP